MKKSVNMFLLSVFLLFEVFFVNAESCCANPNQPANAFCFLGYAGAQDDCCPDSGYTNVGPQNQEQCISGYYSPMQTCNQFSQCEPGCCCNPFGSGKRMAECQNGQFYTSTELGSQTCQEKCQVSPPGSGSQQPIISSGNANAIPSSGVNSIHTGPGLCDGKSEARDASNNAVDSGWVRLVSSDDSSLLVISHDDCSDKDETCPLGYSAGGSVHTGPGKCDGNMEGVDYAGKSVDSGWMALCTKDNSLFFGVSYDDCSQAEGSCQKYNLKEYSSSGMVHTGPGSCDAIAEAVDFARNSLDSGWVELCSKSSSNFLKIEVEDCDDKVEALVIKDPDNLAPGCTEDDADLNMLYVEMQQDENGLVSENAIDVSLVQKLLDAGVEFNLDDIDGVSSDSLSYIIELEKEPMIPKKEELLDSIQQKSRGNIFSKIQSVADRVTLKYRLNSYRNSIINEQRRLINPENIRDSFSTSFNGVAAKINVEELESLASNPAVKKIYVDSHVSLSTSISPEIDDALRVIRSGSDSGIDGSGITIAVIDSGIDKNHPDLIGKIISERDFVPSFSDGGFFCPNEGDGDDDDIANDRVGHGTHVAGIIAADGEVEGIAPGAQLIAIKSLDKCGADSSWILKGIEYAIDPNGDGDYSDRADIISMSLGGRGDETSPLSVAVENAVKSGSFAVVAAGNSGKFSPVGSPGAAPSALTVGASCRKEDCKSPVADFSSRGPTWRGNLKPDIIAPGVKICSSVPSDSEMYLSRKSEKCGSAHVVASGTSMAAPVVSGASALIMQKFRMEHSRKPSPEELKALLIEYSQDLNEKLIAQGSGELDVLRSSSADIIITPSVMNIILGESKTEFDVSVKNMGSGRKGIRFSTTQVNAEIPSSADTFDSGVTFSENSLCIASGESVSIKTSFNPAVNPAVIRGFYSGKILASVFPECNFDSPELSSINVPFLIANTVFVTIDITPLAGSSGEKKYYVALLNSETGKIIGRKFFKYEGKHRSEQIWEEEHISTQIIVEDPGVSHMDVIVSSFERTLMPSEIIVMMKSMQIDSNSVIVMFDENEARPVLTNFDSLYGEMGMEPYESSVVFGRADGKFTGILFRSSNNVKCPLLKPRLYLYSENLWYDGYFFLISENAKDKGIAVGDSEKLIGVLAEFKHPFDELSYSVKNDDLLLHTLQFRNSFPLFNDERKFYFDPKHGSLILGGRGNYQYPPERESQMIYLQKGVNYRIWSRVSAIGADEIEFGGKNYKRRLGSVTYALEYAVPSFEGASGKNIVIPPDLPISLDAGQDKHVLYGKIYLGNERLKVEDSPDHSGTYIPFPEGVSSMVTISKDGEIVFSAEQDVPWSYDCLLEDCDEGIHTVAWEFKGLVDHELNLKKDMCFRENIWTEDLSKCEGVAVSCTPGEVTSENNNDVLCFEGKSRRKCTSLEYGNVYNINGKAGFDILCTESINYPDSERSSFVECDTDGLQERTGNGETADSRKMSYDKQFVCLETDDQEIWVKCGEEPSKPDGTLLTKGQSIWSKGTTYYCCDNKWQTTGCGSGSIHGTVNDKTTGQPVKNARIDVSYTGSDEEVNKLRTFSDQEGNYEAEELPVGTYWIFATPNDQIYPRGFTKVEIIENQDTLANIDMLDISGSISGRVATGSGSPLQNARVEIIFDKVPVISFSENTDKNGYYEKGFLFDSETYVIRVTAPKYKKQEIRVQAAADAKADFHLLKSYRILFVPIETSQVTKEKETFYEKASIAAVSGAGLFKSMSPFSEIDSLETHIARNFCDCSTYEVQIEEDVYSGCMQKVLQCAKEENPNENYHAIIAIMPYTSDSHSGASIPLSNVIFAGLIGVQGYDAAETIAHELFHKQKLCDERKKSTYDRQNVKYRFSRIYDQPLWDFSGCMNEYPLNTGIGPYEPMNQDNCQMDCSKDKSYCEKATCGTKLGGEAPPYEVSIMGGTPRVDGLTGKKEYYLTGIPPDSYEKLKKLIKDWAYK